jgi:anti-anti-sigma factor
MFTISEDESGAVVMVGRLDAVSVPIARQFLEAVQETRRVDFTQLDYVASIGLGLLASTQRRLMDKGAGLVLVGLNPHLREVFNLAGFQGVFEFE